MPFIRCASCNKLVYPMDPQINLAGMLYHKTCRPKNEYKSEDKYKDKSEDKEYYHYTMTTTNRDNNPYRDCNNYHNDNDNDNDSGYQQEFYNRFSDPWKVRNDIEKNGHIVNEFGEVFSPEQVKYYKKLGYNITPDSNIHG